MTVLHRRSSRARRSGAALVLLLVACGGGGADAGPTTTGDDAAASTSSSGGEATTGTGTGEDETGDSSGAEPLPPANLLLMESVIFYDGYAETVREPVPEGIIRHRNSLVATRLGDEELDLIQSNLQMQVLIGAMCDNYDRIGSVLLALAPKGAETYDPAAVPV